MMMNDFLRMIAKDARTKKQNLSSEDFYYMLKYLGVEKDASLVQDIEKFYDDFLDNLNNSLVKFEEKSVKKGTKNATHYIAFYVDKKAEYKEAVKVYFPVKYEYMISALKTVFLYLVRNNIKAIVKFHVKATNEGIVIQFYEKDDVKAFINYCNNNFILNDLLLNTNPFIASVHKIGVVSDSSDYTYNEVLSELLSEYFQMLKKDNILDKAGDLDFLGFVINKERMEENEARKFSINAIEKNMAMILKHKDNVVEKDLI